MQLMELTGDKTLLCSQNKCWIAANLGISSNYQYVLILSVITWVRFSLKIYIFLIRTAVEYRQHTSFGPSMPSRRFQYTPSRINVVLLLEQQHVSVPSYITKVWDNNFAVLNPKNCQIWSLWVIKPLKLPTRCIIP